jgi:outer membrane murein-binding lipoprotein Lpp
VVNLGAIVVLMALGLLAGCASTQTGSTRLTASDFADLAAAVAAELEASDAIAERSSADEPWIVAMDRVENLSGDFIPVSEQWWLMEKVRSALPMRAIGERYAIRFVIPVERLRELQALSPELAGAGSERAPTHALRAVIRSVERTGGGGRTDMYAADFQLVDLSSGEVVWSGRGEIKRVAFGRVWD